ncbi:MAG: EamA family transporter [Candidatus Asgardarchaeia archaeon]
MIVGFVTALVTAFLWGLAAVLIKMVLTHGAHPLDFNAVRAFPVFLFMFVIVIITENFNEFLSADPTALFYLFLATVFGIFLGDTLYFLGIRDCGVTVAVPIAYSYPFFAYLFAFLFVSEMPSIWVVIGGFLIVVGIFFLSKSSNNSQNSMIVKVGKISNFHKGLISTIVAASFFGLGSVFARIALFNVTPIVGVTYRLLFLGFLLTPYMILKRQKLKAFSRKEVLFMILIGIIGIGIGGLLYLVSLDLVGVSTTTTLTATAPFYSAFLAIILLKEKVNKLKILGMTLTVLGTLLVLFQSVLV